MQRAITTVAAALALGLVGCGGQSAPEAVEAVADTFLADVGAGRWDDACAALSADSKRALTDLEAGLGTSGCAATVERVVDGLDRADRDALDEGVAASDVRVSGGRASVDSPLGGELLLVRQGEHWLVDWNAPAASAAVEAASEDAYDPCAPLASDPTFNTSDDLDGDGYVTDDEAEQLIGTPNPCT